MRLTEGQRRSVGLTAYVRDRMKATGRTPKGDLVWTPAEVSLLTRHYPDKKTLVRLLPHRTLKAIERAAFKRRLGKKLHQWSQEEVVRLRGLARTGATKSEFLSAFPGLRWKQIESALERRKVRRKRAPLKVYGEPLFDEIRRQARAHGMFVYELAEFTKSGGYFKTRPKRKNWKHLERGVDLFGGSVAIRWAGPPHPCGEHGPRH